MEMRHLQTFVAFNLPKLGGWTEKRQNDKTA